jgi:hypothetical protein
VDAPPDAANRDAWPLDGEPLQWGLSVPLPSSEPKPRLVRRAAAIVACQPGWLPAQHERCFGLPATEAPPSRRRVFFINPDLLFHSPDPRLRRLMANPGHRLYLHLHTQWEGALIGLGTREVLERHDYFPLRLPPVPRIGVSGKREHAK